MDSAIKILPYYTYSDYVHWEGRWELIDGMPYAMSPAPVPKHQKIVAEIIYELNKAIKKSKCKECKVYDFIDVKVNEDTLVQPDASIVCLPISKQFLDFPPNLVVEVLSAATALKDKNNKYKIYQSFGVKYYLIVDPDDNKIEIYTLTDKGKYEINNFKSLEKLIFEFETCKIKVNLKEIFS